MTPNSLLLSTSQTNSHMKTVKLLLLTFFSFTTFAQSPIFDLNKKLGKGVNLGNTFESPSEGEWGTVFKDDYFKKIKAAGLSHVRMPIRWDVPARAMQTAPYTLNATFLNRIKSVVDLAIKEDLYIIINMHHHESMFTAPDANTERFLTQWDQIASAYKGYDSRVVFEVLNEPHDALYAAKWNPLFKKALDVIRKTNPTRAVLIGPPDYQSANSISQLIIPNDPNLILSLHYYDPFNFTHQGADWVGDQSKNWLGTKWENTVNERNEVITAFAFAKSISKAKNIPINIGEFGAYEKADLQSRVKWTNFLARWFEEQGFSWAYWEFSAGFGIYDPVSNAFKQQLTDALVKDPMYPPLVIQTNTVYQSKIGDATDVWNLGIQGVAKATSTFANGLAKINITQPSTETWHVQLIRNNVELKNGVRYFVSFEIETDQTIGLTQYIGKSSGDYASYSGYKGFTADKNSKFSYSFTMTSPTDKSARIVFDLGKSTGAFGVRNFKIEEEKAILLGTSKETPKIVIYPNPTTNELRIDSPFQIQEINVFDMSGKMILETKKQSDNLNSFATEKMPAGKYIILIKTSEGVFKEKFIK